MARERGMDPTIEEATRAGDFAMLWYSLGKLSTSLILSAEVQTGSNLSGHLRWYSTSLAQSTRSPSLSI